MKRIVITLFVSAIMFFTCGTGFAASAVKPYAHLLGNGNTTVSNTAAHNHDTLDERVARIALYKLYSTQPSEMIKSGQDNELLKLLQENAKKKIGVTAPKITSDIYGSFIAGGKNDYISPMYSDPITLSFSDTVFNAASPEKAAAVKVDVYYLTQPQYQKVKNLWEARRNNIWWLMSIICVCIWGMLVRLTLKIPENSICKHRVWKAVVLPVLFVAMLYMCVLFPIKYTTLENYKNACTAANGVRIENIYKN